MTGAPARGARLPHEPALDGLRGLAVAAVLLFHAEVPGTTGGYLGVSVFFTLSGFLITRLLLAERTATGRIGIGAFYARRARRLVPASAACLLAIAVLAHLGAWSTVTGLRRDLVGAALQVFNWVRLAGDSSYAAIFAADGGGASPVEHYWSLAIEEQFYWAWPLVVGLLLRRRGPGRALGPVAVLAVLAVAAAPVIAATWGPDAAYWATPARIGEILTGAAAGALVAERGAPRWARHVPLPALAVLAVGVVALPAGRGPAYAGWFPALSMVTAMLLLGLAHDGVARRALSVRPLVALGAVSYGAYLYHWPVYTLLDEARLGRGGAALLVARLAATLVIATASLHLLERPFRTATLAPRPSLVAAGVATLAVVAASVAVPTTGPVYDTAGDAAATAAIDRDASLDALRLVAPGDALPAADEDPEARWARLDLVAPTPSRPVRVVVFGDSTAKATGGGLVRWAAAHPDRAQVTVVGAAGCGFVRGGTRVFPGREEAIPDACDRYVEDDLAAAVRDLRPDVALMLTGGWDTVDQRFEGTGPLAPTDPEYRRRIAESYADATRRITEAGVDRVLWLAEPTSDPFWNPVASPQEEPERHLALHEEMRALAAADPDRVAVADLGGWMEAAGWLDDRAVRPDGVHLTAEAAEEVASRWLGPVALAAALRGR